MRRVLACVDLSASTDAVVACGCDLAGPDGELTILHVAAPEPDFVGYGVGPPSVRDTIARELREEHRAVERLAEATRATGIAATALTVQGAAVERILEHAARLAIDFVIVASSSHGALHDLLVGSAIPGLLHRAAVPVVVVPHHPK